MKEKIYPKSAAEKFEFNKKAVIEHILNQFLMILGDFLMIWKKLKGKAKASKLISYLSDAQGPNQSLPISQ
jgi:hypothetical protein